MPALDPVTAIANGIGRALDLIDQFVEDKDKANELKAGLMRLERETSMQIIQTRTVPWVDALVKILYAVGDLLKQSWRPLGGAAALGAAVYMEAHQMPVPEWLSGILALLFPAWVASRHSEKVEKEKRQTIETAAKAGREAQSGNPFLDADLG